MARGGIFKANQEEAEELIDEIKDIIGIEDNRSYSDQFKKVVKDMGKQPVPKQIAVGAGTGWLAGYMTMKVGKMAATVIGGSLILLQIAHHKGYVQVNWNRMNSDSQNLASQLKEQIRGRSKSGMEKFGDFAAQNVWLAGGFTGGFFLGIASS